MNCRTYNQIKHTLKTGITFTVFLIGITNHNLYAQQKKGVKANIGLIYPLSTNGIKAPKDTNTYSLNLIAGVSRADQGLTIAGFANIVKQDAKGLQIAGFSNIICQNASGLQVAGFSNHIGNTARGNMIAGFLNMYGNDKGVAVAGFANVANNNSGKQISGFINIAKIARGAQLSFINIADSAGLQIGIINISKNGEKSLGVTNDENETLMLTFRSGGKWLYGILGSGYNLHNKKAKYAYEAGLGAHLWTINAFRLNTELVSGGLTGFNKGDYFKASARLLPALKLSQMLEVFAGPSLNYVNTDTEEGIKLTKNNISSWHTNDGSTLNSFNLGYTAGVQMAF